MAHVKYVSPAGWDMGVPAASLLKLSRDGGFGANDRRDFVKRAGEAGAHIFENALSTLKFAADTIPVHLIALGAKEAWGANRNGDAFTESVLKACHETFTKYAHWFNNHRNKKEKGDPHFGVVKASAYNPAMRRVELVVELPTTKAAAARLGCNDVDTQAVEKMARGDDVAVSMACRVPYDVCSGCGNKARTRDEYCKAASCPYGGCHDNLTRLVKIGSDYHLLHVENESPCFFDISKVFRPADRTAYGAKADWLQKAAADGGCAPYELLKDAGDAYAPLAVALAQNHFLPGQETPTLRAQVKLAHGLAQLAARETAADQVRIAFAREVQPDLDLAKMALDAGRPDAMRAGLAALADQKIVLPMREFARMTKRAGLAEAAAARMPGVCHRMVSDGVLENRLASNPFAPAEKTASGEQRRAAAAAAPAYSLEKTAVDRRARVAAARGVSSINANWSEKAAGDASAESLARDYWCYQVAALERIARFDDEFMLTARTAVCQNSVI